MFSHCHRLIYFVFHSDPIEPSGKIDDDPSDAMLIYHCDLCGGDIPNKEDLLVHMKEHKTKDVVMRVKKVEKRRICTGDNAWKCDMCDEAFRRKVDLKRHLYVIHQMQMRPSYICEVVTIAVTCA